jgi:transketolase
VIAVSVMLDEVMRIYENEDVTILYYTTLEPFDKQILSENYNSGRIIIYEPEYAGSLDYDIITAFEGKAVQIEHVGFPREIFRNYGTYDEKMKYYGLW